MPAGTVIDLHLRLTVKLGRRDDFLAFLREATPYYESPGGIEIRLLQDFGDPHRFIEIVRYRDEATYLTDQHRVDADPRMREYIERWRSLLAQPPDVEVYRDFVP
jgi:quinol monooxygenase YgiN